MAYVLGKQIIAKLVEALGLQGRAVREVVLRFAIDEPVSAYCVEYVHEDALLNLVGMLPDVKPFVQWVDALEVTPGGGPAVQVVKQLRRAEMNETRTLGIQLANRLKDATPEERERIKAFLYDEHPKG